MSFSSHKTRKDAILIQWSLNGNIDLVDHFIIVLNVLGIKTIVGTAHNISNSSYFEFVDLLTNNEGGSIFYHIIPVYYDYSRGPEIKTGKIVI